MNNIPKKKKFIAEIDDILQKEKKQNNKKEQINIKKQPIIKNTNKNILLTKEQKIEKTVNTKKEKTQKQNLGQFYTTNQDYILQGLFIPDNIENIIEPFTGNGDLLNFIEKNNKKYNIECYDIDPKKDFIIKQDTIKNPPNYKNKFIITNPPYLARNKSKDKTLFDKYDVNDLYKCVIREIINNYCLGGILIIPLNFWSSIRNNDIELRKEFLKKYDIIMLNIFEEQVFDDTTYTICSFQFELKKNVENNLRIILYPSKKVINTVLNDNNNYIIGGEIYNLTINNTFKITRVTTKNKDKLNTNILVKCIDDNINSKIGLSIVTNENVYIDTTPKQSARTYASLIIEPKIDENKQKLLVEKFNKYLEQERNKYNSLFLTNYRESKDIARKRISFDLVYLIIIYVLENLENI
ncbi:DNA or RNA methylase [Hokovirus HKV1]|uniref:DNA or RNA methylase n=1 Tax=Hokovirus HKV1 TaxID=1977638 RepID=A0A1V0SFE4_9VIRU|nr:DNA or RNA methylase [Hokovirus HKV1]